MLDCRDSAPLPEGETFDIEVLVTRTELTDDYAPTSLPSNAEEGEEEEEEGAAITDGLQRDADVTPSCDNAPSKTEASEKYDPPIVTLDPIPVVEDTQSNDPSDSSGKVSKERQDRPLRVGVKKANNAKGPMQGVRTRLVVWDVCFT